MQIYHTICYMCLRTVFKCFTIFFYNKPDLGEDFFCSCPQQAIIVTFFSQTDFLMWECRDQLGNFPTQASVVMTKTIDFFLKFSNLKVGHCAKTYISSTNSAWRCLIWCLCDATSSFCTVTCKEKCVSLLKHDKMAREWRNSCTHCRDTGWRTMVVFNMRWLNLGFMEQQCGRALEPIRSLCAFSGSGTPVMHLAGS